MPLPEEPSASDIDNGNAQADPNSSTQDANQSAEDSSSSSDAGSQDANAPKSLADIVNAELEKGDEPSSGSEKPNNKSVPDGQKPEGEAAAKQTGQQPGQQKQGQEGKGEEKKLAEVPPEFHNHPRWKEITSERDTFKTKAETAQRTIEQLTPDAEDFQAITGFMERNQIQHEEVVELLGFLAMRNQSPEKFTEEWLKLRNDIDSMCGIALPADLQKRVDDGEITEADAQKLSRQGAQLKMSTTQLERRQKTDTETSQQQANQRLTTEMKTTVNTFDDHCQKTDPDYAKKRPLVINAMRAAFVEYGFPKNPEEALKYAKYAYTQVNKNLTSFVPKPGAMKQTLTNKDSSAAQVHPDAKSVRDIVSRILDA